MLHATGKEGETMHSTTPEATTGPRKDAHYSRDMISTCLT
jgi:hypothetical protein